MGFEELLGAIGEEAFRQRDAILAKAREEAEEVLREAAARREDTLRAARERAGPAAQAEALRILSQARLAARREVQAARSELVAAALADLEARLGRLLGAEAYPAVLRELLGECLAEAPGQGPAVLRCRRDDLTAVRDLARALGADAAVEEGPFPLGGVSAAFGPEGRFVCRNGLDDRLERLRPRLLQEAGRLLLGGQGAAAAP